MYFSAFVVIVLLQDFIVPFKELEIHFEVELTHQLKFYIKTDSYEFDPQLQFLFAVNVVVSEL